MLLGGLSCSCSLPAQSPGVQAERTCHGLSSRRGGKGRWYPGSQLQADVCSLQSRHLSLAGTLQGCVLYPQGAACAPILPNPTCVGG